MAVTALGLAASGETPDLSQAVLKCITIMDVFERVDWSYRGEYMTQRHGITTEVANDALADPDRVVIDPDYNSTSGRSVRIIGFSVIVLEDEGVEYGVDGWVANVKDRRLYSEQGEGRTR